MVVLLKFTVHNLRRVLLLVLFEVQVVLPRFHLEQTVCVDCCLFEFGETLFFLVPAVLVANFNVFVHIGLYFRPTLKHYIIANVVLHLIKPYLFNIRYFLVSLWVDPPIWHAFFPLIHYIFLEIIEYYLYILVNMPLFVRYELVLFIFFIIFLWIIVGVK